MGGVPEDLRSLVDGAFDECVDTRRDLHAHPELAHQEHRTSAVIRHRLWTLGWRPLHTPTPTGVIAALDGGGPGATVLLRADLDALPLHEEVDVPYRSRRDGLMHACGHDAHTAVLLGVARVLASRAESLPGRYVALFQPAEELGGGARSMIEGGALEVVGADRVLSLHVSSLLPTGTVAVRPGIAMSEAQVLRLRLRGAGGHGATMGADGNVVLATAELARRLPGVVGEMEYEQSPCACSAGALHAGTAANVVPREAVIDATLRTYLPEQREAAMEALRQLCEEVGCRAGVSVDLQVPLTVPAVHNDPATTVTVRRALEAALGAPNVAEPPPAPPSDDIGEFLRAVPGCHYFVGAQPGPTLPPQHHAPDFRIDEHCLQVGMLTLAGAATAVAADRSDHRT